MRIFLILFLLQLAAFSVFGQGTAFTYQGKLNEGGSAVTTPRDLRFRLFDAAAGGAEVGTDVTVANVAFNNGVFTVELDFGAAAFDGSGRWIETSVSLPGANNFTPLAPRQALNSVPFAVKALNADTATHADAAVNSTQLGGVAANQFVVTTDARMTDARQPLPGSGSYIQNQISGPQASSNFEISGTGRASILSATTQFNLGTSRILHSPSSNLFVGRSTGTNFSSGFFNTIVGGTAGNGMINASANSIFGNGAGFDNQGSENSFFGMNSGLQNQSGGGNSFFGKEAGSANISGSANAFFGTGSGAGNTTGSGITLMGSAANVSADDLRFAAAIGANAVVGSNDTVVIGKASGIYGGVARPADTVSVPGILNTGRHFSLGGSRILTSGPNSIYLGFQTGTNGEFNTFVGTFAGNKNSGDANTFVGNLAGFENLSGTANTLLGFDAGRNSTTGGGNTFLGTRAGSDNISGGENTFVGSGSGVGSTTNQRNTFVGNSSGFIGFTAAGDDNTLLGWNTRVANGVSGSTAIGAGVQVSQSNTILLGRNFDTVRIPGAIAVELGSTASVVNAVNRFTIGGGTALSFGSGVGNFNLNVAGNSSASTGNGLTFVGHFSGTSNTSGSDNSYFGFEAGRAGTTGSGNSAFGKGAGSRPFVGDNNSFIGLQADFANVPTPTGSNNTLIGTFSVVNSGVSNSTAIGYQATVSQSNSVILGNTGASVGIGTTAPKARLDVSGGDILVGPGQGVIFKSPSGTACMKLTINNTPALVLTNVPCP